MVTFKIWYWQVDYIYVINYQRGQKDRYVNTNSSSLVNYISGIDIEQGFNKVGKKDRYGKERDYK